MELGDEPEVEDVASRNPGTLLRTVTLQINQILQTSASAVGAQQTPHRVGGTSLDETGRWRCRHKGTLTDQLLYFMCIYLYFFIIEYS